MALYQFKNAVASAVGTTSTVVYTAPTGKKTIAIGCNVTNTTGAALPVEVKVLKVDGTAIYLAKAHRIDGGLGVDFLQGRKLVLTAGETLNVASAAASSLDCVVSVLEDVD